MRKKIITPAEVKRRFIDCDLDHAKLIRKLTNSDKQVSFFKKLYHTQWATRMLIDKYTLEDSEHDDFVDLVRGLRRDKRVKIKKVKDIRLSSGVHHIMVLTSKGNVIFRKIKDIFNDNILEDFPIIGTDERYGNCHWLSIHFSRMLTYSEIDNKIVTGMVGDLTNDRFLHSWIEIEMEGNEFVIDCTLGAILNKQGYEMIFRPKNTVETSGRDIYLEKKVIDDLYNIENETDYEGLVKLYLMDRKRALDLYEDYYGVELGPIDFDKALKDETKIYPSVEEMTVTKGC